MGLDGTKPVLRVSEKQDSNQSPQLQRPVRKLNFCLYKSRYDTFQKANNKGTYQSVRMRRLVCAFVVGKPLKTGVLASKLICYHFDK